VLKKLFNLEDVERINAVDLQFRSPWPSFVAAVLIACAIAYVYYLYRRESTISRLARACLGTVRVLLLSAIVFVLFEPVLAMEVTTRSRGTILILVDTSGSMEFPALRPAPGTDARKRDQDADDIARAIGRLSYDKPAPPGVSPEQLRTEAGAVRRIDVARGILQNVELNLVGQLVKNHDVEGFVFGDRLTSVGKGEAIPAAVGQAPVGARATSLGSAIEEVVTRAGRSEIEGIILLSDGASNSGVDPRGLADELKLKDRHIPIQTVGIGPPNPPDVRVEKVIAPDTVFSGDRAPLRIEVFSTGYQGQMAELRVWLDDSELGRKSMVLTGGTQYEDLFFVPPGLGRAARAPGGQLLPTTRETPETARNSRIVVEVEKMPGETAVGNNTLSRPVQVIDNEINVLYVEGSPRWEYRYLRTVLLRDPRLDVKFLMTEGDRDLPDHDPRQYLRQFPEVASEAFTYDLVILGEVPATYFNAAQLAQIERLVKDRSGSLLILAGRRFNPTSYRDTPVSAMLPVTLGASDLTPIGDDVYPVVTAEGYRSTATSIDANRDVNDNLWRLVKPLYHVPNVAGVKPGAKVLLELPSGRPAAGPAKATEPGYPLVAWHRYGTGKVMYVGTDQLWRLRFKHGDEYHARFWGQTIQFLALSRLLGGNKRIHLDADRKTYQVGEQVKLFASVLTESYDPLLADTYTVHVVRQDQPGTQPYTTAPASAPGESDMEIRLKAEPNNPGYFQAAFVVQKHGHFVLRLSGEDSGAANLVEFDVEDLPLEQRESAMQEDLLKNLAGSSGGRYYSLHDLPNLVKTISEQYRPRQEPRDRRLWDDWVIYLLVVAFGGVEWYFRRRYNLV
jgi:hypothetical protein